MAAGAADDDDDGPSSKQSQHSHSAERRRRRRRRWVKVQTITITIKGTPRRSKAEAGIWRRKERRLEKRRTMGIKETFVAQ